MKNHLKEINLAKERIKNVIKKTPLIYSDLFSELSSNEVYIKPENLQKTGAFKIRGAYNKLSQLSDEEKSNGLVASSAGNHAQGVAYAAKELGVKATIVMPKNTPFIKVDSTRGYGAEVVLHGSCYDEAYEKALEIEKNNGATFIHPFNDMDVIYGQGTIGLEILEELEDADAVLVPIGGGGLISGISLAIKSINPNIRVIGVEPEGATTLKTSLMNGKVTELDRVQTIADGVAVKKCGDKTYDIIKDYVDDIITVSDYELMKAFLKLLEKHKLVCEHAGVLTLAATTKLNFYNKKVVSVVSGGNIDVVTISSMINNGLVSSGRLFCFSAEMPDVPGELLKISEVLKDLNANVIKLEHNQFKALNRIHNVVLEVTVETHGYDHIEKIKNKLNEVGYDIKQIY
ncbi:threonine ammonia-lyase [Anaeromicrobium sediminis]|uniref:L-threonine dehydratase catabolic TdcB n=1 Tax=Anaeromicrobium sediminis TaxID=1478221 RepID=A0A267MM00_9FIRM|nr:threonine ammonia-lyase [Anaeromicrobium sediminis]PAB59833.1 threonine ammonia-lyase [Anaeromicrobium sediminis]